MHAERYHFVYCLIATVTCFVCVQDWWEPPAVLKLLLRCLFHIFFSLTPPAAANTLRPSVITEASVLETEIEKELRNTQALRVAAEALCILCANIERYKYCQM